MVTCVGKTSEPHVLAFFPSSAAAAGPDLIGENGIAFQVDILGISVSAKESFFVPKQQNKTILQLWKIF
jgi:hypothetical protein